MRHFGIEFILQYFMPQLPSRSHLAREYQRKRFSPSLRIFGEQKISVWTSSLNDIQDSQVLQQWRRITARFREFSREWWPPRWVSRKGQQPNLAAASMDWPFEVVDRLRHRLPLLRPTHPSSRPPKGDSWPDGWSKGSRGSSRREIKIKGTMTISYFRYKR